MTCLYAEDKQPNILIILADDMGYADMGCQGSKDLETPHLDKVAASGTRFKPMATHARPCVALHEQA